MSGGAPTNPLNDALTKIVAQLDSSQWLSRQEIERRQGAQLARLAAHCAAQSPHFRARLTQAEVLPEDLASLDALGRLPVLSRRALQSEAASIFCRKVPPLHLPLGETRTSGSTGEPVAVKRTAHNHLIWLAMSMRELLWHRAEFAGRFSASRATVSHYGEFEDWGQPAAVLFRTGRSQAIPITASIGEHARRIAAFAPQVLLIYPNMLDALARHCASRGVTFAGLKLILTVGETLRPEVRALARTVFGAVVADNYSSQELGAIALQCPDSDCYHVMSESTIVEVLREDGQACRVGETGRVIATDLQNFATPMVRYDIGDYAEVAGTCSCGRGLPALRRILGRERNLILMPDGSRHWPLVGFSRFRDVAPVAQYQMIQRTREDIEVRLVVEVALNAAQESDLRDCIAQALGYPFQLSFRYFDGHLPRGLGGKFDEFVCEVKK